MWKYMDWSATRPGPVKRFQKIWPPAKKRVACGVPRLAPWAKIFRPSGPGKGIYEAQAQEASQQALGAAKAIPKSKSRIAEEYPSRLLDEKC
jgi:hypothetical protein